MHTLESIPRHEKIQKCSEIFILKENSVHIRFKVFFFLKKEQTKYPTKHLYNHYTPHKIARIQNTDDIKCWRGCGATGTLIACCWECKMVQPLSKASLSILVKLNMLFLYHPAIMLLDIYREEWKIYVHTKAYMGILTAALFITTKLGSNRDALQ